MEHEFENSTHENGNELPTSVEMADAVNEAEHAVENITPAEAEYAVENITPAEAEHAVEDLAPDEAEQPEPAVAEVAELSLLAKVEQAYQSLQTKYTENQQLIQEKRNQIADLRARMRELAADNQVDTQNGEEALHNGKLLVQHDSCSTLISHAEQIREHIYHNSSHAESLLAPMKASLELLELRLQYVRNLEGFVAEVKTGLGLQERLHDIDQVIATLVHKLEVV